MTEPYGDFRMVVRGIAPERPGLKVEDFRATVDGGCGFDGSLIAACFGPGAALEDSIEIPA